MRLLIMLMAIGMATWVNGVSFAAEKVEQEQKGKEPVCEIELSRRYGQAKVSKFVSAADGLSFICCVDDWPDIIGRNIKVKIARLTEPQSLGEDKKFYYKQLELFFEEKLSGSVIELCNICRDTDSFAIIADVKVGGRFLAPELIKQALAELQSESEPLQEVREVQPVEQIKQPEEVKPKQAAQSATFVCSKNSKLFHEKDCASAKRISETNLTFFQTREEAISAGKSPCSKCKP